MKFKRKPLSLATALVATAGLAATNVVHSATVLEEVVVTATKRAESVQDVSIPLTAVSGEQLERQFAQDLRDLTDQAPNVQFEPVGIFQNAASFNIRGQGTGDIESAADGKVGIYIDGVVQARVSTALSDMVDVQAVEILRGPQGTLFGRNTIAGAVQILHNKPVMNKWGANLAVQGGDFGRQDVKGVLNVPLIEDTLAGRIAFKTTKHDGYWENDFVDQDRGGSDRVTILPSLAWAVNDNLDITIRGEWNETRDDTNMTQSHHYCRDDPFNLFLGLPADNDLVITTQTLYNLIVLGQDPVTAAAGAASICGKPFDDSSASTEYTAPNTEDRGQQYNTDVWGVTLQADYDWNDWGTFTYIGNYREVEEDIIFTIDVSLHDLFAGRRVQDHYQYSHELRFASSFSDKFDFVAGLYYFEQEYEMKQSSYGMLFAPNIVLNAPDPTAITFTNPSSYGQAQFSTQLNEASAAFFRGNWHVTDKLTLTAGLRYTSETKDFAHCAVGSGNEALPSSAASGARGCNNSPAFVIDPTLPPIVPSQVTGSAATPVWQLTPAIGFDSSGGAEGGCRPVLDPTGTAITCNNRLTEDEKWTATTPMAGVTYNISDDAMVYFTYSEGFTAGGFNGRGGSVSTIGPFEPETGENFELGLKSEWFDNRLRVNITMFDTEVEDFQTAFIRPAPGGGGQETIQSNLGSFETDGWELELTYLATDNLTFWFNYSALDTERIGFCTDPDGPSGTDPTTPPSVGGPFSAAAPTCGSPQAIVDSIGAFQGWLVPVDVSTIAGSARAPDYTWSAGFAYHWNLDRFGDLMISADWQYSDDQVIGGSRPNEPDGVQQFNGDFIAHERGATDIYNASMVWRSPERRYEVAYFQKNIGDELYNQATTVVGGLLNFRVPNIRRHWGLELRVSLGGI